MPSAIGSILQIYVKLMQKPLHPRKKIPFRRLNATKRDNISCGLGRQSFMLSSFSQIFLNISSG